MKEEEIILEQQLKDKHQRLTELKTQFFKHEQSLMNWKGKFKPEQIETQLDDSLYVKQLALNKITHLEFDSTLKSALFDIEDWDFCWLSILIPTVSGQISSFQIEVEQRPGYNFHTAAMEKIYNNPFIGICNNNQLQFDDQKYQLSIVLRKIDKIDQKSSKIYFTEKLEKDWVILDFKVYHPMVESISNFKK